MVPGGGLICLSQIKAENLRQLQELITIGILIYLMICYIMVLVKITKRKKEIDSLAIVLST